MCDNQFGNKAFTHHLMPWFITYFTEHMTGAAIGNALLLLDIRRLNTKITPNLLRYLGEVKNLLFKMASIKQAIWLL